MTVTTWDFHGGEISASTAFPYRGYSISVSTIPSSGPEIVVFGTMGRPDLGQFPGSAEGFRTAMEAIDELIAAARASEWLKLHLDAEADE